MRNKFSSRSEAISDLKRWRDAKSSIKALFMEAGLMIRVTGNVLLFPEEDEVLIVDKTDSSLTLASFPILGNAFSRTEPLLDLPENTRWRVGFFVGISFPLPCGTIVLYEIAD
jgi:hypothetical protein